MSRFPSKGGTNLEVSFLHLAITSRAKSLDLVRESMMGPLGDEEFARVQVKQSTGDVTLWYLLAVPLGVVSSTWCSASLPIALLKSNREEHTATEKESLSHPVFL